MPIPAPRRLALAGTLVAAFAILAALVAVPVTSRAANTQAASDHPIIARAYQDLGNWGGQCFTWVRQVVADSLGREIGFDYHLGYTDAGATLVYDSSKANPGKLADVLPGDIVQIASATDPSADVEGLHTFIVTQNLGNGTFDGIDSNANWDEIVRERSAYDPARSAKRYPGLAFRIYRFPVDGVPLPAVAPSGAAAKQRSFSAGERAVVVADGTGLNLRAAPGTDQAIAKLLADYTEVTVVSGEVIRATGRDWVQVATPFGVGYVALQYLQPPGSAGSAASGGPGLIPTFRVTIAYLAFSE